MSSFLTDARVGMLTTIAEDVDIAALVKRWFRFEDSLLQRYEVELVDCPAYAFYPGRIIEPDERYNAAYDLSQSILAVITTAGQDPSICEELVDLTLAVLRTVRDGNMLGLTSAGLKNIVPTVEMDAFTSERQARLMWQATVTIEFRWIRFR